MENFDTNNMELVSGYMRDDTLRHELNELTRKTYGFDFESWVTGGYFEGDYIPYSFRKDGKIIANVSANRMCFMQNGRKKNYIQIGTVMTDEAYRKKGLAKSLLAHVVKQYEKECDGFYLFANLDALGFYEKAGFQKETEYRYSLKEEFCRLEKAGERFIPVEAADRAMKQKYLDMVRHSVVNSALEQINKFGLQLFYTADMDNVYYAKDIDCFIVAEREDDVLLLQSIVCEERVTLLDILQRIDFPYNKCRLGFTPLLEDTGMCVAERYDGGEDYRLFYRGSELECVEKQKLYFPELSHA